MFLNKTLLSVSFASLLSFPLVSGLQEDPLSDSATRLWTLQRQIRLREEKIRESLSLKKKTLQRAGRTAAVFVKISRKYKKLRKQGDISDLEVSKTHKECAKLVLNLCRVNGGLFIKMGQHAASLRPAIPEEYIVELESLQDKAPQKEFSLVKLSIENELNSLVKSNTQTSAEDVFENIEEQAIGSASLAQVHKAKLKGSGEEVAIKVKHMYADDIMESDIQILRIADRLASFVFKQEGFSLSWAVDRFEKNIRQELDFTIESRNTIKARSLIEGNEYLRDRVYVPKIFEKFSSRNMIVMEYIDGFSLADSKRVSELDDKTKKKISQSILDCFGFSFFNSGFLHCDPHPGNILIDSRNRVVLIDHGSYKQLSIQFRNDMCMLWRSLMVGDNINLEKSATNLGLKKFWRILPILFVNRPLVDDANISYVNDNDILVEVGLGSSPEELFQKLINIGEEISDEFFWVARTMHLVKDLNTKLGGSSKTRFKTYAFWANHGYGDTNDGFFQKTISSLTFSFQLLLIDAYHVWSSMIVTPLRHLLHLFGWKSNLQRRESSYSVSSAIGKSWGSSLRS